MEKVSRLKVFFGFFSLTKPPNHMIQVYSESAQDSLQVHFWKYFPMVRWQANYLISNLI